MPSWSTTVGATSYSIVIVDRFVRMTRSEASPDTYGGNDVPAQRFLRSERLQQHVREVFGESVLAEVLCAAEAAARLPLTRRQP